MSVEHEKWIHPAIRAELVRFGIDPGTVLSASIEQDAASAPLANLVVRFLIPPGAAP